MTAEPAKDLNQMPKLRQSGRARQLPSQFALYTAAQEDSGQIQEPELYQEAINDPIYGKQWESAIQEELALLAAHNTWRLVSATALPAG